MMHDRKPRRRQEGRELPAHHPTKSAAAPSSAAAGAHPVDEPTLDKAGTPRRLELLACSMTTRWRTRRSMEGTIAC